MDLQWYYTLSLVEYCLIALFLLLYAMYVIRYIYLTNFFKKPKSRILIKLPIRFLYFTLLLIALMGPSFGYGTKFVQTIGKDIYFLIDLSKSMHTQDIPPSRLEKVRYELKNLIKNFSTDRIGLIVFTSEAFLQCPLTYDHDALELAMQNMQPSIMPDGSTNFKPALELAFNKLLTEKNKFTDVKSKIVILMSDGEDFGEDINSTMKLFANQGIKLFTVGIGTTLGGKIPIQGGFLLNSSGQVVESKLNYKILEDIARQTGGKYFEVSKDKNEIPQMLKVVNEIKGQRLDVRAIDVSYNKYEYFLWVALLLISLDVVLIVKVIKL